MKKYCVIVLTLAILGACSSGLDPSNRDLRSPCVSNSLDFDAVGPCNKHSPIGNPAIVA
jgi:hypothetical protein